MIKIIIVNNSPKNKIAYFVSKILNGITIPEILFISTNELKNIVSESFDKYLIYNSDDEVLYGIVKDIDCEKIDFGFNENAKFRASDVNIVEDAINFKLNFKGNSAPFWFKNENHTNNADEIYDVLPAICVGDFLGLNIIEISENLKK